MTQQLRAVSHKGFLTRLSQPGVAQGGTTKTKHSRAEWRGQNGLKTLRGLDWLGQPIGTCTVLTKSRSGRVVVYSKTGQVSISAPLSFGGFARPADCKNSFGVDRFFSWIELRVPA